MEAIVRTGEVTPYANLILCAGISFSILNTGQFTPPA
ncbi:MAG: RbsD/FucU domain-containing protein [Aeromonas sp.]